jgi:hypothetical protein
MQFLDEPLDATEQVPKKQPFKDMEVLFEGLEHARWGFDVLLNKNQTLLYVLKEKRLFAYEIHPFKLLYEIDLEPHVKAWYSYNQFMISPDG